MNKRELVDLLNDNFHDNTNVVFYFRESDTCYKVDSIHGLFVDYLKNDVIALEGHVIAKCQLPCPLGHGLEGTQKEP